MGFNAWKDPEIGRNVKAGEKGIRIIAPSPFKVKKEVEKIDPDTKKPVVDKDGKRCIAGPGQLVDIDEEGNVYVDDVLLEEPYRTEKALGDCNIELPYQVPENRFFLIGDHHATSVDSRNTAVGCVAEEQIVGKIVYRVWPLKSIGPLG